MYFYPAPAPQIENFHENILARQNNTTDRKIDHLTSRIDKLLAVGDGRLLEDVMKENEEMKRQQVLRDDQIKGLQDTVTMLQNRTKVLEDASKMEADEIIQVKATNKELIAEKNRFGAIKKELDVAIMALEKRDNEKYNDYSHIKYDAMQETHKMELKEAAGDILSLTELLQEKAKQQNESNRIIAMLENERDDAYSRLKDEQVKYAERESMYFKEADIRANGYVQVIDKLSQELEVMRMGVSKKQSIKCVTTSVQTCSDQEVTETKLVRKRIDIIQLQNSRNHQIQELQFEIRRQKNDIKTKDAKIEQLNRICRALINMKEIVEVVEIE